MRPALKAGLIGGVVLFGLNLLGLIPFVGCITLILEVFLYVAIGALAARWMAPRREGGAAAGQGAIAGVIAAAISGIARTVIMTLQMAVMGSSQILSQLPAESLQQLRDAGIDPAMFVGPGAGVAIGGFCCVGLMVLAAGLGALGGLIYAAARPE